jgi:hypothetical protein
VLPNLIVIGAARSGTTSLHHYLNLHPQIRMSERKELDFFAAERNWSRGLAWYQSQFSGHSEVLGESSPCYSRHPVHAGVPERMASIVPDAKLIYLVRDPLERTISDFSFSRRVVGRPGPGPDESLGDLDRSPYVASSRYAMQLELYLEHYPLERILVVDRADLAASRTETMQRIFSFLEVDAGFDSAHFAAEYNALQADGLRTGARAAARMLDRVIGGNRARRLRASIPRAAQRPFTRPRNVPAVELNEGLRLRLEECLGNDADRLRELTGQAFSTWSV